MGVHLNAMTSSPTSTIKSAAARLRALALAVEGGMLLGSEEELLAKLGVSRGSLRQVARLLEGEGLIRVRRGANGGYFAARPDIASIEQTVSGYLATLAMGPDEIVVITSLLWVETVRRAASLCDPDVKRVAEDLQAQVAGLQPDSTFAQVVDVEQASRAALFDLVRAPFIELIFQVAAAFAHRRNLLVSDETDAHREFVPAWRNAKLLELSAIRDADPELGVMAAARVRKLWERRVALTDDT